MNDILAARKGIWSAQSKSLENALDAPAKSHSNVASDAGQSTSLLTLESALDALSTKADSNTGVSNVQQSTSSLNIRKLESTDDKLKPLQTVESALDALAAKSDSNTPADAKQDSSFSTVENALDALAAQADSNTAASNTRQGTSSLNVRKLKDSKESTSESIRLAQTKTQVRNGLLKQRRSSEPKEVELAMKLALDAVAADSDSGTSSQLNIRRHDGTGDVVKLLQVNAQILKAPHSQESKEITNRKDFFNRRSKDAVKQALVMDSQQQVSGSLKLFQRDVHKSSRVACSDAGCIPVLARKRRDEL